MMCARVVLAMGLLGCGSPPRVADPPTVSVDDAPRIKPAAAPDPTGAPTEPEACGKGVPSSELIDAAMALAANARECYRAELRNESQSGAAPEGRLMVRVEVNEDGAVRSARAVQDSLGRPSVTTCVTHLFSESTLPRPQSGCVIINVPLAFLVKQPDP
jgi:hypothetical protein